jgi:hypothetical protein
MTKSEQIRLTHWRFKVLQQASDARSVARTCRHYGISARRSTSGDGASPIRAWPGSVTGQAGRTTRPEPNP